MYLYFCVYTLDLQQIPAAAIKQVENLGLGVWVAIIPYMVKRDNSCVPII